MGRWLWWIVGAVALVGAALAIVIFRRRKSAAALPAVPGQVQRPDPPSTPTRKQTKPSVFNKGVNNGKALAGALLEGKEIYESFRS